MDGCLAVVKGDFDMTQLSTRLSWDQAQTKWASTLNPVLSNPILAGSILSDIELITGVNVVNHRLARQLQGYIVILNSAAITLHDSQSSNQRQDLTLILNSSGGGTVSLYVF